VRWPRRHSFNDGLGLFLAPAVVQDRAQPMARRKAVRSTINRTDRQTGGQAPDRCFTLTVINAASVVGLPG